MRHASNKSFIKRLIKRDHKMIPVVVDTDPNVKTYGINDLMELESQPIFDLDTETTSDGEGVDWEKDGVILGDDGKYHVISRENWVKVDDVWEDSGQDEANATDDSRFTLTVVSRIEEPIVIRDLTHYEATKKLQLLMNSEVQSVLIVKDS